MREKVKWHKKKRFTITKEHIFLFCFVCLFFHNAKLFYGESRTMLHGCVIAKVQIKIYVILWNCFKPSLENHTFCYRCNVLRNFTKVISFGLFTTRFSMFISHAVFVTLTKNRSSVIKAHQKRSSALDPVVWRHGSCFQVHGHHEGSTSRCSRSVWIVITRACVHTYISKRKVTKLFTNSLQKRA